MQCEANQRNYYVVQSWRLELPTKELQKVNSLLFNIYLKYEAPQVDQASQSKKNLALCSLYSEMESRQESSDHCSLMGSDGKAIKTVL